MNKEELHSFIEKQQPNICHCDCHYVSKKVATQEEIQRSNENKRSEVMRGGRKEF